MKIWIDDIRPAPEGYVWVRTVNTAKMHITSHESFKERLGKESPDKLSTFEDIEFIDLDHDAGEYAFDGGDYIKLLDWLEETGRNYPIRIHSQNPVGVANMRRIIERNGWKEIR